MKKITLVFRADPGHGWLKCKRELLGKFNVEPTPYSYERNGQVYLEEDCDAPKLLEALKAAGVEVKIKSKHTNKQSKIRSYNSYRA